MKINEILTESVLQEGPLLNKIGTAVGKGVGALAKGAGAVAGGVAGLGAAAKKGYQAGKATVATGGDDPAAPTTTADPTAAPAEPQPNVSKAVGQGIKQGLDRALGAKDPKTGEPLQGKTQPAAQASTQAAAPTTSAVPTTTAAPSTAPATAPTKPAAAAKSTPSATTFAQVKASIDKLPPADKQKLLQLLQKAPAKTAPVAKPVAATPKSSAAKSTAKKPVSKSAATTKSAAPVADPDGRIEPTMDPTAANYNNQTAGGKQTVSTGSKFDPATMKNTAGTPIPSGTVPNTTAPVATPQPGMTQDGVPQYDPATGQGAKYDGITGEITPGWQAQLDKDKADKQAAAAGAGSFDQMASQLTKPKAEPDYGKLLADKVAQRKAEKAAATTAPAAPAAEPTGTGQAAIAAANAGEDPEAAAIAAMKAKNPKLAAMMAQAGLDDQGNDVAAPAGRRQGGGKVAGELSTTPGAIKKRAARDNNPNLVRSTTESIDYLVLGK